MLRSLISVSIFFLLSAPATADRVTLIYGDVLEGKVLHETDTTVTIRGPFGEIQLPKNEVKEIRRDSDPQTPPSPTQEPHSESPWGGSPQTPPQTTPQTEPVLPHVPTDTPPTPYELLKGNVEIQSQWKDLEIAYLQRAYIGGQTIQTQFIGRTIPPRYFRSKLTTPIPASPQFPQGGEVEYDMYRTGSMLYQVVKAPGQPVQYLRLDLSKIPGFRPGDNQVESFRSGFVGAGTDEELLQAIARNSTIIGSENIDGHDCWVLETVNTPELIEIQVSRQPPEMQESLRQQLMRLGRIRSWVGKEDLNQWRMENYSPQGDLLLSMKMVSIKPNQGLTPQDLRMKVPKGTEWIDMTEMVAGQFHQLVGGSPGLVPIPSPQQLGRPYQSAQPPQWPQSLPPTFPQTGAPGGGILPPTPPQGYPAPPNPFPVQPQSYNPPSYPEPQPNAQSQPAYPPAPPPFQRMPPSTNRQPVPPGGQVPPNSGPYQQPQPAVPPPPHQPYVDSAQPQPYWAVQQPSPYRQVPVQEAYPVPQQSQGSSGIGGFFRRIFGGSTGNAPGVVPGGVNQQGNQTIMVPIVNGQPRFPAPPR